MVPLSSYLGSVIGGGTQSWQIGPSRRRWWALSMTVVFSSGVGVVPAIVSEKPSTVRAFSWLIDMTVD